jgi:hypothetical protein
MLGLNLSLAALAVNVSFGGANRAVLSGLHDAMTIAGAVGDPVSSWSGSVAGGAVYTPLGTAPTIGAKNGLRFIDDSLAYKPLVATGGISKQNRRIFVVCRPDGIGSGAQRPIFGNSTGASSVQVGGRYASCRPSIQTAYGPEVNAPTANSNVASVSPDAGKWQVLEFDIRPNGSAGYINGVEVFSNNTSTADTLPLNTLLGGRHNNIAYPFSGAISMVTEYDTSAFPMTVSQLAAARAAANFRAFMLDTAEASYSLAPQDDGSFGVGYRGTGTLAANTALTLAGPYALDNVLTVGNVVRVGGAAGVASLSFAADSDHLYRPYNEAPAVDAAGVAMRISVASAATVGRIAHTTGVGCLGFLLEVDAGVLRVTVSDGTTTASATRDVPLPYGEPFGVAAAIGPNGLLLCAGPDGTTGSVQVAARSLYGGAIADKLFIGGAGITIYGGSLYSPQAFDAANLIVAKNGAMAVYGGGFDWSLNGALSVLGEWDAGKSVYSPVSGTPGAFTLTVPNSFAGSLGAALTQSDSVRVANIVKGFDNGVPKLGFVLNSTAADAPFLNVNAADKSPLGTSFYLVRRLPTPNGSCQFVSARNTNSRLGFFADRLRFTGYYGTNVSGNTPITSATGWVVVCLQAVVGSPAILSFYTAAGENTGLIYSGASVTVGGAVIEMIGGSYFASEQSGELEISKVVRYTGNVASNPAQFDLIIAELASIAAQANG